MFSKFYILCATSVLCTAILTAQPQQQFQWIKSLTGPNPAIAPEAVVTDLAVDPAGNTYLTGEFKGEIRFAANAVLTANGADPALFLAKYNTAGALQWYQKVTPQVPSIPDVFALSARIAVDNEGRLYWAANYSAQALAFSNGLTLQQVCNNGCQEGFLLRLDDNGSVLFSKKLKAETGAFFQLADIATAPGGMHYVCGTFEGSELWLQGGANMGGLTTDGFFLGQYNPEGNAEVVVLIPEDSDVPEIAALCVSSDGGRIGVSGQYDSFLNFGSSNAVTSSNAAHKRFFAWFSEQFGSALSAGTLTATEDLRVTDIRMDGNYRIWAACDFKGALYWKDNLITSSASPAGTIVGLSSDGTFVHAGNFPHSGSSLPVATLELGGNGAFYAAGFAVENVVIPDVGQSVNHGCSDLVLAGGTGGLLTAGAQVGANGCESIANTHGGTALGISASGRLSMHGNYQNGAAFGNGLSLTGSGIWVGQFGGATPSSTTDLAPQTARFYPNPSVDGFEIYDVTPEWIRVSDVTGRVVYHSSVNGDTQRVRTFGWSSGIYVVQYGDAGGNVYVGKLYQQ